MWKLQQDKEETIPPSNKATVIYWLITDHRVNNKVQLQQLKQADIHDLSQAVSSERLFKTKCLWVQTTKNLPSSLHLHQLPALSVDTITHFVVLGFFPLC